MNREVISLCHISKNKLGKVICEHLLHLRNFERHCRETARTEFSKAAEQVGVFIPTIKFLTSLL